MQQENEYEDTSLISNKYHPRPRPTYSRKHANSTSNTRETSISSKRNFGSKQTHSGLYAKPSAEYMSLAAELEHKNAVDHAYYSHKSTSSSIEATVKHKTKLNTPNGFRTKK